MAVPAPPKPPWWHDFIAQNLVPSAIVSVIASLVATGLSVYSALNAHHEQQREYNKTFESLIAGQPTMGAFGGTYVPAPGSRAPAELAKANEAAAKAGFEQSVAEQRAAANLIALESVADTETQQRTVLLLAARLLNADPRREDTGGPAARVLAVLIDQIDRGRTDGPDKAMDERLWRTVQSQSFRDLVTAGYSNDYYNDSGPTYLWPTLNGDQPITSDAKLEVLHALSPPSLDGWVHLATFGYPGDRLAAPLTRQAAARAIAALTKVMLHDDVDRASARPMNQYAVADPSDPADRGGSGPLFGARALVAKDWYPSRVVMLKARLLRDRPPVEYVNPDGTFEKGSLGQIIGEVSPGVCVHIVEPVRPVLVFIDLQQPGRTPRKRLDGLLHMWAHVHAASDCTLPGTTSG